MRQLSVNLPYLIHRNQRIFGSEKEINRTGDFTRARQRAWLSHRNATAVEAYCSFDVLIVMRRRKISITAAHTKAGDADRARFGIALALQMRDRRAHILHH